MLRTRGRPRRGVLLLAAALCLYAAGLGAVEPERGGGVITAVDLTRTAIQVNRQVLYMSPSIEVQTPAAESLHGLAGMKALHPGLSVTYTLETRDGPPRIDRLRIHTK